jgi:arylsulfatase A-like enzyme
VSQVDLPAAFAALAGATLPPEAAPDSFNVLPALLGESPAGRDHLVEAARVLAYRQGPWKLIASPEPHLYNLARDPGERRNVATAHPEILSELAAALEHARKAGRSRPAG